MNTANPTEIQPDTLLTSYQVGSLLQVNPSSVNKWVKDGRIQAFRTPGGHRRIRAADLVMFLHSHEMPVPRGLVNAARRRLLVVDDVKKELDGFKRLLKPYAHMIDLKLIDNGIDALVLIGSFRPHVVIIDVQMPGLDGIEVCRRLRALDDMAHVKVVVATGQLTADIEKKAKKAGATMSVQKPIALDTLLELLDVYLQPPMVAGAR